MTVSPSKVREAVLAVARDPETAGPTLAALEPDDLASAMRACTNQGLGTACTVSLRRAGVPIPEWLERHRFDMAVQRTRILTLLAKIAPVLDASGIPWAVLKGPVTASSMDRPELREFVDLDILIPGARVADLIAALEAVGIEQMNQNWAAYVKHGVAEFPVQIDGVQIDVHWHLVPLRRTRRQFSIDIDAMLARRRRITFQGVEFPALDPIDHLIHVCVHAGVSGANKGGWLRDVAAASAAVAEWSALVSRASSYRALPLVAQVLDRVDQQQLRPMPPIVATKSPRLVGWRRRRDTNARPSDTHEQRLFSGFPVAVARSSVGASVSATLITVAEHLTSDAGRPPRWSTFDPDSDLYWSNVSSESLGEYLAYAGRSGSTS